MKSLWGFQYQVKAVVIKLLTTEQKSDIILVVIINITTDKVYAEMQKNPLVEICAFKGSDIVRYYGKSVVDDNPELFDAAVKVLPLLAQIYNEQSGLKLAIFSLENAKAEYSNMLDYNLKKEIKL